MRDRNDNARELHKITKSQQYFDYDQFDDEQDLIYSEDLTNHSVSMRHHNDLKLSDFLNSQSGGEFDYEFGDDQDEALQIALELSYNAQAYPATRTSMKVMSKMKKKKMKRRSKGCDFESYWTAMQQSTKQMEKTAKRRLRKMRKIDTAEDDFTEMVPSAPQKHLEFQVTLSLEKHSEYEVIDDSHEYTVKQSGSYPYRLSRGRVMRVNKPVLDIPLKLRNFKLIQCSIKCLEDGQEAKFQESSYQYIAENRGDVYIPIYSCLYESAYKSRSFEWTFNKLQNVKLKEMVSKLISCYAQNEEESPVFPPISVMMNKLKFDECHKPYYHLLPLSMRVSRVMMEYIPIRHILEGILIPLVGYDEMYYLSMNLKVPYPVGQSGGQCYFGNGQIEWVDENSIFSDMEHPVSGNSMEFSPSVDEFANDEATGLSEAQQSTYDSLIDMGFDQSDCRSIAEVFGGNLLGAINHILQGNYSDYDSSS